MTQYEAYRKGGGGKGPIGPIRLDCANASTDARIQEATIARLMQDLEDARADSARLAARLREAALERVDDAGAPRVRVREMAWEYRADAADIIHSLKWRARMLSDDVERDLENGGAWDLVDRLRHMREACADAIVAIEAGLEAP